MLKLALLFTLSVFYSSPSLAEYSEITWDTLIPEEARALLRKTKPRIVDHNGDAATQAFSEGHLMLQSNLSEQKIRMPGFVVPLETKEQKVLSFFLVPYFGACIHVPPPPPNQLVYVETKVGIEIESIHIPIWVEGVMALSPKAHNLGYSGYKLTLDSHEVYEDY